MYLPDSSDAIQRRTGYLVAVPNATSQRSVGQIEAVPRATLAMKNADHGKSKRYPVLHWLWKIDFLFLVESPNASQRSTGQLEVIPHWEQIAPRVTLVLED